MNFKELVAVLGHELRTPLAAILGYQELLADGIFGELDPRTEEPLARIESSALQLLYLIDGLQELIAGGSKTDELESSTTDAIATRLLEAARPFAESRGVRLQVARRESAALHKVPLQRLLRASALTTIAAVKCSASRTIRLDICIEPGAVLIRLDGTGLDPAIDQPDLLLEADRPVPLTAPRLRLAMAAATLTHVHGSIQLQPDPDGTAVLLRLPLGSTD
jgi:signal transduction histidine kinase